MSLVDHIQISPDRLSSSLRPATRPQHNQLQNMPPSLDATFHGFVETTMDTLLLFEACRQNLLPKITRRLQDRERKELVVSGTVFIFDEKESGK